MAAVKELLARPTRTGMYFVVHASMLTRITYTGAAINLADEFFKWYHDLPFSVDGFHAVKLDDAQIEDQRPIIRISSYRWDGKLRLSDVPPTFEIPTNFMWFFEAIRTRNLIGWVDFIANIGVSVEVPEVINYMGKLYADSVVLGAWELSLDSLMEAERRGWIHQETAYGNLDTEAAESLFEAVRAMGLHARRSLDAFREYARAAGLFARLLACRAYDLTWQRSSELERLQKATGPQFWDGFPGLDGDEVYKAAYAAARGVPSDVALLHALVLFTRDEEEYKALAPVMKQQLCTALHPELDSLEEFEKHFGKSIVTAYLSRELTYEADRDEAVTSVARAIVAKWGSELSATALLQRCWQAALQSVAESPNKMMSSHVQAASLVALEERRIELAGLSLRIEGCAAARARRRGIWSAKCPRAPAVCNRKSKRRVWSRRAPRTPCATSPLSAQSMRTPPRLPPRDPTPPACKVAGHTVDGCKARESLPARPISPQVAARVLISVVVPKPSPGGFRLAICRGD